jgi:D-3-phosphoglycerate dehydrogenase
MIPPTPEADEEVRRAIPGVPFEFLRRAGRPPWPGVEALLVAGDEGDGPGLSAEAVPDLRFAQHLYTGLDDFPFDRLPPTARVAGNVGAFAVPVAEHALALVLALALAKGLPAVHAQSLEGRLRPVVPSVHLAGKTALVLGFGAIGSELAPRLRALGLRVEGSTRDGRPRAGLDRSVGPAERDAALARADVIVNCLPLTRATRGSIDAAALARTKPGAIFVNVGRAATVDPAALAHHLAGHPDFRLGLDVWWDEDWNGNRLVVPPELAKHSLLLATPHSAGVTPEARGYVLRCALENLARYFRGEEPRHVADRSEYADARAERT